MNKFSFKKLTHGALRWLDRSMERVFSFLSGAAGFNLIMVAIVAGANGASAGISLGLLATGGLAFTLMGVTMMKKPQFNKLEEERLLERDIRSLKRSSTSTVHGRAAHSIAATYEDLVTAYEESGSTVRPDEMEHAKEIMNWAVTAMDSLNAQDEEIQRMKKYVQNSEEKAELVETEAEYSALFAKFKEADVVMSGYYRDMIEMRKSVVAAKRASTQAAIENYPIETAQELTYLRKAENEISHLKISSPSS